MPGYAGVLPVFVPLGLLAGAHEVLHFHLLKLAHAEGELTGYNLIAEGLAGLGYTKGDLHTPGLLDVEEVYKDALSGLGAQVHLVGAICYRSHFGGEHQVELTYVRPVAGTGYAAGNLEFFDEALQSRKIIGTK